MSEQQGRAINIKTFWYSSLCLIFLKWSDEIKKVVDLVCPELLLISSTWIFQSHENIRIGGHYEATRAQLLLIIFWFFFTFFEVTLYYKVKAFQNTLQLVVWKISSLVIFPKKTFKLQKCSWFERQTLILFGNIDLLRFDWLVVPNIPNFTCI